MSKTWKLIKDLWSVTESILKVFLKFKTSIFNKKINPVLFAQNCESGRDALKITKHSTWGLKHASPSLSESAFAQEQCFNPTYKLN